MKKLTTRTIIIFLMSVFIPLLALGQSKQKVAVYVTGAEGDGVNEFIGAYLVDAIVNGSNYLAIERTADFIRELNKEQEYQRTGAVDDDQISLLGQQFGVQLVCIAKVGKVGHRQFVSARMIDVESATVKSSTKPVFFTVDDIDKSCTAVAISLISGEPVDIKRPTIVENSRQYEQPVVQKQSEQSILQQRQATHTPVYGTLTVDKTNVYHSGVLLNKEQIMKAFAQSTAFDIYNKGISKHKRGNLLMWTGIGVAILGVPLTMHIDYDYGTNYYHDTYFGYDFDYTSEYYENYGYGSTPIGLYTITPIGLICAGVGLWMQSSGKKLIRQAVNTHNNSLTSFSNMELNFGFTPNGIGLVLNF